MNDVGVIEIGREAFWVILQTGGPILIAGLVIGLLIALFQALTSIQEMTLVFVPKIIVIFFALMVMLPYMINNMVAFGETIFDKIIALG
ncbi:flagellar biosynthesis protein [Candidatus Terasakiella magnetica]|uniref:Flagellar biosynthetic protein FliQ n=1 Tax=Candidatus Terasakiella magnetica TaxID=1867952 RepID=A0A1C3RKV6_9PROT|nr:flagellar biosynthesis protein FliQ [Candidatus Terasakiella magnetica]SCA57904.1 flagellar biosynthesis protein [Candidatus Terasakiella magnetica]